MEHIGSCALPSPLLDADVPPARRDLHGIEKNVQKALSTFDHEKTSCMIT